RRAPRRRPEGALRAGPRGALYPSTARRLGPRRARRRALASCRKEAAQLGEKLAGLLLGDEVSAGEGAPAHVGGDLAPVGKAVEERLDDALPAPEGEHRHADFLAQVLPVVDEVDGGRGAVILAGGVDGARIPEGAGVLRERPLVEVLEAALAPPEPGEDVPGHVALQRSEEHTS